MRLSYLLAPVCALLLWSCDGGENQHDNTEENAATIESAAEATPGDVDEPLSDVNGEKVLFNGENLEGWHYWGGEEGTAWKVDDEGVLYLDASNKEDGRIVGGGDLVSDEVYGDYELSLEWKISECGNSGIIYNVIESEAYDYPWKTGPEMQILDNDCHPDAKIETHRAGDLYDMIETSEVNVKPAGEWNSIRLVVTDGMVQHWQNGQKVVEYNNKGDEWEKMIADSKFKDFDGFGSSTAGHIVLQDHSDPVYFRNIRIREL